MTMSKGRFVWYDLMTPDVEGAKRFYGEAIGWKTQAWEGGDASYTMWAIGEQAIGGLMALPAEAEQMGAPPHWMGYVAVPDVDASAAKAKALGGTVHKEPTDIPSVGRFAVVADPQGAAIALFTDTSAMSAHDGAPRRGDFTWHELNTTDWAAAWGFYEELFGWKKDDAMDMGPEMGTYQLFRWDGAPAASGGMSDAARAQGTPASWLYYVLVDDLDAAVGRIQRMGGKVLNGPMEVPGGDRVAQCMDPQGAAFAVHWRKPR